MVPDPPGRDVPRTDTTFRRRYGVGGRITPDMVSLTGGFGKLSVNEVAALTANTAEETLGILEDVREILRTNAYLQALQVKTARGISLSEQDEKWLKESYP